MPAASSASEPRNCGPHATKLLVGETRRHRPLVQDVVPRNDLPRHAEVVQAGERDRAVGDVKHRRQETDREQQLHVLLPLPRTFSLPVPSARVFYARARAPLVWRGAPHRRARLGDAVAWPRASSTLEGHASRGRTPRPGRRGGGPPSRRRGRHCSRHRGPEQARFDEILVFVYRPGHRTMLRRVQWTREHGFVEDVYRRAAHLPVGAEPVPPGVLTSRSSSAARGARFAAVAVFRLPAAGLRVPRRPTLPRRRARHPAAATRWTPVASRDRRPRRPARCAHRFRPASAA